MPMVSSQGPKWVRQGDKWALIRDKPKKEPDPIPAPSQQPSTSAEKRPGTTMTPLKQNTTTALPQQAEVKALPMPVSMVEEKAAKVDHGPVTHPTPPIKMEDIMTPLSWIGQRNRAESTDEFGEALSCDFSVTTFGSSLDDHPRSEHGYEDDHRHQLEMVLDAFASPAASDCSSVGPPKHPCQHHLNKELELYCTIHNVPICANCVYSAHADCVNQYVMEELDGEEQGRPQPHKPTPFVSIEQAALTVADKILVAVYEDVQGKQLKESANRIDDRMKELEGQMEALKRQLAADRDSIVAEAHYRYEQLVDDLQKAMRPKVKALMNQKSSILERSRVVAKQRADTIQWGCSLNPDEDPFHAFQSCLDKMEEEQERAKNSPSTDIYPCEGADLCVQLPPSNHVVETLRTRGWAGSLGVNTSSWSLTGPFMVLYSSPSPCILTLESNTGESIGNQSFVTARARLAMKPGLTGKDVPVTIVRKDEGRRYEVSFEATEDLVGRTVEVEALLGGVAVGSGVKRVAIVNNILSSMVFFDPDHQYGMQALLHFLPDKTWRLLYRASRDGWSASDFHSRCDKKGATVILAKTSGDNPSIFGGYTSESWESTPKATYKKDPTAFLFSLVNTADMDPVKLKLLPFNAKRAIVCDARHGPIFGKRGGDLFICDHAHTSKRSMCRLGGSYRVPLKQLPSARTFMAGRERFTLEEYEVYEVM